MRSMWQDRLTDFRKSFAPWSRPRRLRSRAQLLLEPLEDRTVLSGTTIATPISLPISPGQVAVATGSLPGTQTYAIDLNETGQIVVQVHATTGDTRLTLLDSIGRIL